MSELGNNKKKISNARVVLYVLGIFAFLFLLFFCIVGAIVFYQIDNFQELDRVYNDKKLCESLKIGVQEVVRGNSMVQASEPGFTADGEWMYVKDVNPTSELGQFLTRYTYITPEEYESRIKSKYKKEKAHGMRFRVNGNEVEVEIEYSDKSGKKGRGKEVISAD